MKKLSMVVCSLVAAGLLNFSFSDLSAMKTRGSEKQEKEIVNDLSGVNVQDKIKQFGGGQGSEEITKSTTKQDVENVAKVVRFARTRKVASFFCKKLPTFLVKDLPVNIVTKVASKVKKLYPNTKMKACLDLALLTVAVTAIKYSPLFQDGFCANIEDPALIQNILHILACHK